MSRVGSAEGFDVWNVQDTWFWLLIYPHRGGGAIGVAPTKTEAVREASTASDQLSEPCRRVENDGPCPGM
jgi:hypothetical protein